MNRSVKDRIAKSRNVIILTSIIIMLTGLFLSRILLSSGLIVFTLLCLIHPNISAQIKNFFSAPFLWSMSLLFFLPFVSGLWSKDTSTWLDILRIKLPFFLLPVCFAGLEKLAPRDWQKIAFIFLGLTTAGVLWSLWQYLQNANSIAAGYLQAHTIVTPLDNDHVRFSLLVSFAILTAIFLLVVLKKKFEKIINLLLATIALLLTIYLHILAARTGLICFYAGAFIWLIWLLAGKKNAPKYSWMVCLIILLPLVSWFVFPTFKNRVRYLKYDLSFVKNGVYQSGSNDGNRLNSIRAGWQVQNNSPWGGVGFGDIKNEMAKLYEKRYPQMTEDDKILPSSEWIMYGAGTGWPGLVLFSVVMLIPFFIKRARGDIAWWLLNIFMASSYLFDIGLEVQYGVFMHAFILLWWYKWAQGPET